MDMFCFQCEQTAHNTGCTIQGVCGKKADTANFQDELLNLIIKLSKNKKKNYENIKLIIEGLFTTITNVNFENSSIENLINKIKEKTDNDFDFDISSIFNIENDNNSLKCLILFGLKGMSAYYHHANVLGYKDKIIEDFIFETLDKISSDSISQDELISLLLKTGEINLKCMELLDKANTETFGNPEPTTITKNIEKGAFIVVSGHDLYDLKLLLEQTKDKNINIYTHGEMLPALAYPEFKKYPHLKGNFGTAWQNQQKEFDNIPAPILFTTNCIMPPKDSYKDRIFTTSVVHYPNCTYIDESKDFTPIINKAVELGGYDEEQKFKGINNGETLHVGYGRNTMVNTISKLEKLFAEKKLSHIFLVGGCDGAKAGRNYYTEFVELAPKDTIILTLACGKYRFNDLELGKIDEIPRLLDMGQCNDAYGAIVVLQKLSEAFNCSINDLPLSIILSWYEQKAVAVLLTLLYLGIENIKLGPSLPAFISNNILKILIDKFKISLIKSPQEDLKEILR